MKSCTSLVQVEEQHLNYMCLECHVLASYSISGHAKKLGGKKKKKALIAKKKMNAISTDSFQIYLQFCL